MLCPACEHIHEGSPSRCEACDTGLRLDGRLSIERRLGRGGSSRTYLAQDQLAGRAVAVKVLDIAKMENWKQLELFKRQHEVLSSLRIDGVPEAYGMFEAETATGSRWCFEHEFIEG